MRLYNKADMMCVQNVHTTQSLEEHTLELTVKYVLLEMCLF